MISKIELPGVKTWRAKLHSDLRGEFMKVFDIDVLSAIGFEPQFKEVLTSSTYKGGLRGMHLQTGDYANYRLVFVAQGAAQDVLLDLRKGSPTYGKYSSQEVSSKNGVCILIPPGVAHGFQALDMCVMQYMTTTFYSEMHDTGVNPLTFGYDWPLSISFISERDLRLPTLAEWNPHE